MLELTSGVYQMIEGRLQVTKQAEAVTKVQEPAIRAEVKSVNREGDKR
jgi:hypothetical protein